MPSTPPRSFWLPRILSAAVAAVVSACTSGPTPRPPQPDTSGTTGPAFSSRGSGPDESGITGPVSASKGSARSSAAASPHAYRQDGATHLYGLNAGRIYKGKMPPLLYAVGVLNVEIDRTGRVRRLDWMRAPRHAPEVMAEIERTVREASPFPVPARLGKVVYTDTWLWHKDGKFQLDTLTEGQD
jgi:periplasmic protein TonB